VFRVVFILFSVILTRWKDSACMNNHLPKETGHEIFVPGLTLIIPSVAEITAIQQNAVGW